MLKVKTLLLALCLQNVGANSFLRTLRRLSQEKFLSYEPLTTVTDHAAIDLDQKVIEEQLALETDQGFAAAMKVYSQGAFSKPYAEVQLDQPLPVDVAKGVEVFGQRADGKFVRGSTAAAFKTGESIIQVQYHAGTQQETYHDCHVGGNPEPNTEGCFRPTGAMEIGEIGEFTYTYNPIQNNFNARTLQGFSLEAQAKMYECGPSCPYPTYDKFFRYYGIHDYANQWVLAAFNRGGTNFAKGNADFSVYGMEGRTEAIKKGIAYMNVWMYVIREMEDAIDDCNNDCATDACNDDQVHAWDEAVAFYTGSVPKISGDGGYLLYTLAQKRCENFGTCLQDTSEVGMAKINSEIFKNFRMGKQDLQLGKCDNVRQYVSRISSLMTVPLVQGVLRYAYVQDKQNDNREKAQAEGATFAAAVLPVLNACNEDDATIVYNNMRVGNTGTPSFEVVKAAFENNYNCMGITCEDVGGLIDEVTGGYLNSAEPCGFVKKTSAPASQSTGVSSTASNSGGGGGPNVGLAVGLTLGIVAFLIIVALLVSRKGDQKEYDGAAEPEMT